jgi:hypothetical protein
MSLGDMSLGDKSLGDKSLGDKSLASELINRLICPKTAHVYSIRPAIHVSNWLYESGNLKSEK